MQCEGTPGDVVQFARYLPMIKDKGANVLVEAPAGLADLLSTVTGVDKVVVQGADLPAFDLHAPLLSLPAIFGTTTETVPSGGAYVAPPDPGALRLPVAGDFLKVGVAWADERGPAVHGPMPGLKPFLELAGATGVTLFSLQTGPGAADLTDAGAGALIIDMPRRAENLSALSALVDQMDIVVAVDCAVAHIAGALAKETWVVAPVAPDWRWGMSGETTPWYATARLLRNERRTDWQTLFEQTRRI